jgi:hypothetical protein
MKDHIVAAALCTLVFAPCLSFAQTGGANGAGPIKPGSVQITTRAPEPGKWDVGSAPNGSRRVFKCKPLACSDPETVSFTFQKGSLSAPDPKALEKLANVDLPKSIRAIAAARAVMTDGAERIETLFSKASTLKNYPSVLNETKFSRGPAAVYVEIAIIFAGPVIIRVESKSPSRDLAKNSLEGFVAAMQIVEGPPPPPPPPASPNPRLPKTQSL